MAETLSPRTNPVIHFHQLREKILCAKTVEERIKCVLGWINERVAGLTELVAKNSKDEQTMQHLLTIRDEVEKIRAALQSSE